MIVIDIDGSIADDRHRLPLRGTVDWDDYHDLAADDAPIHGVVAMLNQLASAGQMTWLVTARPERTRQLTTRWLLENKVMVDRILMRPDEDWRPAPLVKLELIHREMTNFKGLAVVDVAFDSRDDVCEAYRGAGLVTAEVKAWARGR